MKDWFKETPKPDLFEENASRKHKAFRWKTLTITVFVAVAVIGGILHLTNPVTNTAKSYLEALKNNDIETAINLASGSAVYNMEKNKETFAALDGSVMEYQILDQQGSRQYGTIDVVIETKVNNSVDVNWYRLHIAKSNTKMRVFKVESIAPVFTRESFTFAETDEVKKIFKAYMESLHAKNWDGAGAYLAGQALTSFNASKGYLEKSDFIKDMTEPEVSLLWKGKKMAIVGFTYKVSDRNVSVNVTFYKTSEGWRIVNVANS